MSATTTPTPTTEDPKQQQEQGTQNQGESKTFTQADIDAIIGKTKAEMKAKQQSELEQALKAEREKFEAEAKMTEEEREKARDEELKKHLADKEAELNRREATNRAKELLSEKSIDQKFASFLISDTIEATEDNVKNFAKIFDQAVEATTTERLKGKTPEKMTDEKSSSSKFKGRTISQHGRTGF